MQIKHGMGVKIVILTHMKIIQIHAHINLEIVGLTDSHV